MPRGDDSWNPFPRHPFTPDFKQNQRVVHTQVFKEIEVGEGPNKQKQLWVTEIDADGIERLRRPEFFFHGIVGHVKEKWGYHINGWRDNVETPAEDIHDDGDDTSQIEFPAEVPNPHLSVPMQISQLAHIMYNILLADPEFNAPILEMLQIPPADPSESNIRLFTSAELAQLGSHLAVTANTLARRANPEDCPADYSDDDDQTIPRLGAILCN
ncbi:unnamed protein product [Cladocopium goreaui]|uniref:Uncharacterized protein n=1 Tax=Cladocopium goreaui TaxID=2562237 RepID=A0A9P1CS97_9DINO|nr:unnamed protein product [Cladocopium goreaui]